MGVKPAIGYNKYTNLNVSTALSLQSKQDPQDYAQGVFRRADQYQATGKLQQRAAVERLGLDPVNPRFAAARGSNQIIASPSPLPGLPDHLGGDSTISRGFIRRADPSDSSDPTNGYRLRFMYNPEYIQRSYISYLDQQSLDPFNSVHGSQNSAAAPGVLDFSFELFFDREVEVAQDINHEGVLLDFKYFDLVVRGVVPDDRGATLPDNGVMMVNPRDVVIVFSDELSVRGRPYNASVRYEKFAHDMTPVRVRINVTVKAMYVGPEPPSLDLPSSTENRYEAAVPYDTSVKARIGYFEPESDDAQVEQYAREAEFAFSPVDYSGVSNGASGGGSGGGSTPPPPSYNGEINIDRVLWAIREIEPVPPQNYQSQNSSSSASGAYQFLRGTWNNYGGYSEAYLAPPRVQDERARIDVVKFLNMYNNQLIAVPVSWLTGSYTPGRDLNYHPGGNNLTVAEYVKKFFDAYNRGS